MKEYLLFRINSEKGLFIYNPKNSKHFHLRGNLRGAKIPQKVLVETSGSIEG
jgi:hypothetical protein